MHDGSLDGLTRGRVLLLEPNAALRSAIQTLLLGEGFQVTLLEALDQVAASGAGAERMVALVAWQCMEGMLAEERRDHLGELTRRLKLVIMVPRRWARLLEATDLSSAVSGLVHKPFEADELIGALDAALATRAAVRLSS